MSSPILHANARGMCPHAAQLTLLPAQARVRVSGQAVYTANDPSLFTGCPFNASGVLQPCTSARWLAPSARVRVMGAPVVVRAAPALALAATQAPQGPVTLVASQARVRAL